MSKSHFMTDAWGGAAVMVAAIIAMLLVLWANDLAGDQPRLVEVVSPAAGIFSRAEYRGGEPFVEVGQQVVPQTVVGVIDLDAMEPVSQIAVFAGVEGRIVEVLADDGAFVQSGQPLMMVDVSGGKPNP